MPGARLFHRERQVPEGVRQPVGVLRGQVRERFRSSSTDSSRSKTFTGSGVATRSQPRLREVTITFPGPFVGKYWRTTSMSSALSNTRSQSS
ncbi:hypothetical protein SHKM778_26670 [Streptomyces sp. KM77-8]|uniref:Uncharacterized protein n=1 Tax=Streptomyces haneummycinicus TaxID=3074435 RepID=A0AAT9HFU8_9ACTN